MQIVPVIRPLIRKSTFRPTGHLVHTVARSMARLSRTMRHPLDNLLATAAV